MKIRVVLAALAALGIQAGSQAKAGPAWEFTAASDSYSDGSWDFGNDFTVNSTVTVSGLGYYADPTNGFVDGNQVTLYDSSGVLLASATVTNVNPLTGHFRYVTIPTLTLKPGTYQIDGVSGADNYTWNDVGFTTDPAITYLDNYWYIDPPGPTFQTAGTLQNDVSDGYWGPNLFLGTPTFVPEPATLTLLGVGLAGMGLIRRRRAR